VPFAAPWGALRACVHVGADGVAIARRPDLPAAPAGDLLQAGPLLVRDGVAAITHGDDEGFTAGAHQFDSDISDGRHPRCALALTGTHLLAVACDGRGADDAGLTLAELATALVRLGARSALNLDGGGSASLVCDGELVNRPREQHGIDLLEGRAIATALALTT
jgi:exopolysaccharide biosynthesis protein